MVNIPKWVEAFFTPQLNEVKGELKAVNTRLDSLRNELTADIARVEQKIDSLSEKVDLVRDVERLKIEVAELKNKTR